jgi:hypothetical protein
MYSRREFLKISGIVLAGSQLISLPFGFTTTAGLPQGRALDALPVYKLSSKKAEISHYLWPDSVISLIETYQDWYQVPGGYVERERVQPITLHNPSDDVHIPHESFWGEVISPVAAIRTFCSPDAPLVTRIGHGGVAQVVDYLPGHWYGLATESGEWLGWSSAKHWQPIQMNVTKSGEHHLEINLRSQSLTAWEDGESILSAPCSTDQSLKPGHYTIWTQKPGGGQLNTPNSSEHHQGIPWLTQFSDQYTLAGAYWHNRFGRPTPGTAIQVTPLLAQWLYSWLNDHSQIHVI